MPERKQPKHDRKDMKERQTTGRYNAPLYDDAMTQMGARIAASEFAMAFALPSEVDDAKLQDMPHDRATIGEKRNKA